MTHEKNQKTVLTGSWDGNFKIWDLRNPSPSFSVNMGQKIYCSDLRESTCILGLGDSQVVYLNFASGLQQALSVCYFLFNFIQYYSK